MTMMTMMTLGFFFLAGVWPRSTGAPTSIIRTAKVIRLNMISFPGRRSDQDGIINRRPWRPPMKTIETTQTAGPDKLLHVTIPVDEANRPYRMVIVIVAE